MFRFPATSMYNTVSGDQQFEANKTEALETFITL